MDIAYVETTIVGNVAGRLLKDPSVAAQQQLTRDWWVLAPRRLEVVVSQLVLDECGGGDPSASQERLVAIENFRLLAITQECRDLATDLMRFKAVPEIRAKRCAAYFHSLRSQCRISGDVELQAYCERVAAQSY